MELCQRGKLKQFPMTKSGHFKQKKSKKNVCVHVSLQPQGKRKWQERGTLYLCPGGGSGCPALCPSPPTTAGLAI